jgi:hypothetical protein
MADTPARLSAARVLRARGATGEGTRSARWHSNNNDAVTLNLQVDSGSFLVKEQM